MVFLENAYRILKENGRLGIVLSNSIASIDSHRIARKWLVDKMRIVAIFDLPANVFAETGVNTSVIVAYKPSKQPVTPDVIEMPASTQPRLALPEPKNIPQYKIDYSTFETMIDKYGNPILDEDFTQTVQDFRQWCIGQEQALQDLFIKDK